MDCFDNLSFRMPSIDSVNVAVGKNNPLVPSSTLGAIKQDSRCGFTAVFSYVC